MLPADQFFLNFGGVFGSMQIWIDGVLVADRPYQDPWWYNAYNQYFDIDITGAVTVGESNELVIRVDNDFEWGGIYRRIFAWSLSEPGLLPGDIDGDGFVGGNDLAMIITNWGLSGMTRQQGDLNGDGLVGGADYSEVVTYWGSGILPELIPEPATLLLLSLAVLVKFPRKRRLG